MKSFESYSAAVIQPIAKRAWSRKDVKDQLNRMLELIDVASLCAFPKIDKPPEAYDYAPVKLMAFPEFFLQGWTYHADLKKYQDDILITIPGEETDLIGERTKAMGSYVCGSALEYEKDWPDRFLSCAFIVGPEGKVIHKYHKFNCWLYGDCETAPHDMFDMYMEKYGKGKSILETFFPVADTKCGKIGTYVCYDATFPETTRALALNGAEILVYMTGWPTPVRQYFEVMNRMRAIENCAYVVAVNDGGYTDPSRPGFSGPKELPVQWWHGDSMIVDYRGVIQTEAPHHGESIVTAPIYLRELRKRRMDYSWNNLLVLRSEVWREMYKDPIYPKNQFLRHPIQSTKDLHRRAPVKVIEDFVRKGILTKPE